MIRTPVRILSLLTLPALAWACGGAEGGPAGPDDAAGDAHEIQIVAGSGQHGRTGMYFPDDLSVQVSDPDGEPVTDATVDWTVLEGPLELSRETSVTNAFGRTKITLRADTELGSGTVRASVRGAPGVETFFHQEVSAYQVIMKSDQYRVRSSAPEFTIQVGDTVEWLNKDMTDVGGTEHYMHSATSVHEPPGGTSFDSPMLGFDDTFRWAPETTGRWEYTCKDHPQNEVMHGTITVVAN